MWKFILYYVYVIKKICFDYNLCKKFINLLYMYYVDLYIGKLCIKINLLYAGFF